MKEKLRKAYLAYQMDGRDKPQGQFFRTDPETKKKTLVRISHDENGQLALSMKSADPQLLTSLRSDFDNMLGAPLSAIHINDLVVLQAAGAAPNPGQGFNLSRNDFYVSINGGPIFSNGQPLGRDCQARFIKRFTARCAPNAATQFYDEFRLI